MKYMVFSYRFGREILEHANFHAAWDEIESIVRDAPVFTYPNKSKNNRNLCVVQQVMNTYFDRVFATEHGWTHHPLATGIEDSQLTADFRKSFEGRDGRSLTVQAEVQFGNMSRWYSDIFKFQAAYSQKLIQLGLCIVPQQSLARLIDSNVVNFERAIRELPSAELSITLPIIMIGVAEDPDVPAVDISKCQLHRFSDITGRGCTDNRRRIVHAYLSRADMTTVGPRSDTGPEIPSLTDEEDEDGTA